MPDFLEPIPQGNLPRLAIPVLELAEHANVQLSSETTPLLANRNNEVQTLPAHLVFSVEHGEDYDDDDDVGDDIDIMLDEDNIAVAASKDANASIPLDMAADHMPSPAMPLFLTDPSDGSLNGDVEHDISIQDGTVLHVVTEATVALEFSMTWNYGVELRSMIKKLRKSLLFLC